MHQMKVSRRIEDASALGSARALACWCRRPASTNLFCPEQRGRAVAAEVRFAEGAETSTRGECALQMPLTVQVIEAT
jgi:hypothetical protein